MGFHFLESLSMEKKNLSLCRGTRKGHRKVKQTEEKISLEKLSEKKLKSWRTEAKKGQEGSNRVENGAGRRQLERYWFWSEELWLYSICSIRFSCLSAPLEVKVFLHQVIDPALHHEPQCWGVGGGLHGWKRLEVIDGASTVCKGCEPRRDRSQGERSRKCVNQCQQKHEIAKI